MNKQNHFLKFSIYAVAVAMLAIGTVSCAKEAPKPDNEKTRLESLAKLTKTLSTVENYYVDKLTFSEIVDKAISGLMGNLDAHSGFLDEKAFTDTKIQTTGEFGGLGITVGIKDGALTVIAPIEGTPADKAGIKSNDVILRIDGNTTIGITVDEAVSKMRGKPKTPITITIVRKGEPKPFDVKIIRDIIKVESVYAKMIEGEDMLYLRVTNFDQHVTEDAVKFIKKYPKAKGIILDLRNNPGGLLDQAIDLTNLFIADGVIVSQKGRTKDENTEYKAKSNKKITDLPLVVLVNSGSASASEIVSGSLQDHKRGVVIGENTFGKGSVQVLLPVDEKEALRLTIARYYLPSGRTIQAVGVVPDLIVYPGKVPENNNGFSIKETDLKKHLEGELAKIEPSTKDHNTTKEQNNKKDELITQADIVQDIQLKTAIDTIKVLNIKQSK